jgi:predicted RND superfamily exporter protein
MAEWYGPSDKPIADAAAYGASQTGVSIWINAIMVCAGFYVLTLGKARPLQNVGGLTAAAMLAAAVATFVTIPALARKRRYTGITKVNTDKEPTSHPSDAVLPGTGPS